LSKISDNATIETDEFSTITGGTQMTYGEVVLHYLDKLGVSQSELARRMNTGRQTINSIIKSGKRGPTIDTALAISRALGVPLQEMVDMMEREA
jgi:plasmid maintenance system antidote protein VapI